MSHRTIPVSDEVLIDGKVLNPVTVLSVTEMIMDALDNCPENEVFSTRKFSASSGMSVVRIRHAKGHPSLEGYWAMVNGERSVVWGHPKAIEKLRKILHESKRVGKGTPRTA